MTRSNQAPEAAWSRAGLLKAMYREALARDRSSEKGDWPGLQGLLEGLKVTRLEDLSHEQLVVLAVRWNRGDITRAQIFSDPT